MIIIMSVMMITITILTALEKRSEDLRNRETWGCLVRYANYLLGVLTLVEMSVESTRRH